MNEHPLLAQLAQLTGEFITVNNPSAEQLRTFQTSIATALLQQQSIHDVRDIFQFEGIQNFTTQHLNAEDVLHLNTILQNADSSIGGAEKIKIFRREVPFISSQVKGSVPDWARGANISETMGPFINNQGRRFWFDIYKIVEGVKVYLQGGTQPALILSLGIWKIFMFNQGKNYTIPECSVWINAHLLSTLAPEDQYCGLKVKSGSLNFSNEVYLNEDNTMVVQPGTNATLSLEIIQQINTSVSPDDTGLDAKNVVTNLPDTISFSFSHFGGMVMGAGNAACKVYDQEYQLNFLQGGAALYHALLNRINIPYSFEPTKFSALYCYSTVCNIKGEADITNAFWSLSCARLDINNPLEASGAGGIVFQTTAGLSASWMGLKDLNLQNKEWINLRNPLILIEPGRIGISDLTAGNANAKQQYILWKKIIEDPNKKEQWNTIDLQYADSFFFFYNCTQEGNESVATSTNCTGNIEKPVDVERKPFALESLQTIFLLSYSQALQLVVLYDDNLLADAVTLPPNNNPAVPPDVVYKKNAIALNNALLTVSPVTGFLLYADLKNEREFDKALLVYSFGLLGYLPTLPDPYAADLNIYQSTYSRFKNIQGTAMQTSYNSLLVCSMIWLNTEQPLVSFAFGDIANQANANNNEQAQIQNTKLNLFENKEILQTHETELQNRRNYLFANRYKSITSREYERSEQPVSKLTYSAIGGRENISQLNTFFNLLDVSTAADLFGVSIGFVNEQLIFGENFHVEPIDTTKNPLAINGMDVVAASRFVRVYTVPQISWEPVLNITAPFKWENDPPAGILKFDDDGYPAMIGNTGTLPVSLAPIPATKLLAENYNADSNFKAWSIFTLPNGMFSIGRYDQQNNFPGADAEKGAQIDLIKADFKGDISAGLQIVTKGAFNSEENNYNFEGSTTQQFNTKNLSGTITRSILGRTVTDIFNDEFSSATLKTRGVPVERYDFSGYGANVFSHWLNDNAEIAATSQAIFDVWRGRTSKEIIQVRSIIYPWAIRVVRTITMYRSSTGFEYRVDSGWRADSDGVYNFSTKNEPTRNYTFHPGLVKGVFNVKNIIENDLAPYTTTWFKTDGVYVDPDTGHAIPVNGGVSLDVELIPVYFDADVKIDDVEEGKTGEYAPSKKMLGYLQKAPRGVVIRDTDFAAILNLQNGLGGPVDCLVNINNSGQRMRVNRVEINSSFDEASKLVFVTAAKGMPVLPKDGSWSLVSHSFQTKEVTPITNSTVSLIRKGELTTPENINQANPKEITPASELFKAAETRLTQYGFLQNTDTQKVLFRNPYFKLNEKLLQSTTPDLADAYRLLNSKGVFPKIEGLAKVEIDAKGCAMKIIDKGYQMVDKLANDTLKAIENQVMPKGPWKFVDTDFVKVYVEYNLIDKEGNPTGDGILKFDLNSEANNWANKMNDITMVVDLLDFQRLFFIKGSLDTQKGQHPEFKLPKLVPGKDLAPIIEILEILEVIGTSPDYSALVKKGLQVVMSNSPNNWEYKFQADKEIPVLRFPAAYLDGPTTPMRLEANLKVGCYFNLAVPLPPNGLPAPSAGAFIEFGAKLSVMCVSLAAATIYAVGQCNLRISADTAMGPALYMKFGFGVELMVGLPVVGNVSVLYMVGIEISLDSKQITVAAFLLFRGRAELIGGLVTVTIQIEASGKIHKEFGGPTYCVAQVTFSIDICICFVIDIDFSETWQESRQIA